MTIDVHRLEVVITPVLALVPVPDLVPAPAPVPVPAPLLIRDPEVPHEEGDATLRPLHLLVQYRRQRSEGLERKMGHQQPGAGGVRSDRGGTLRLSTVLPLVRDRDQGQGRGPGRDRDQGVFLPLVTVGERRKTDSLNRVVQMMSKTEDPKLDPQEESKKPMILAPL